MFSFKDTEKSIELGKDFFDTYESVGVLCIVLDKDKLFKKLEEKLFENNLGEVEFVQDYVDSFKYNLDIKEFIK